MVFVSYSRRDKSLVYPVVKAMRITNEEIFLDIDNIPLGQPWNTKLEEAIRDARCFALFWSSTSSRSELVRNEWTYAVDIGTPNIVPVRLDSTPLPEPLQYRNAVNELSELYKKVRRDRTLRILAYAASAVLLIAAGVVAGIWLTPAHAQPFLPGAEQPQPSATSYYLFAGAGLFLVYAFFLTLELNKLYHRIAKMILGVEDTPGEMLTGEEVWA